MSTDRPDPASERTASERDEASSIGDRYREIYEGVALPVLMIDAESWRIVAVNDAAVAQYGYTREEFIGMSVLDVRPPDGRSEARRILSEMPHGFWKATAVRHRRKDGSIFRVDVWSRDTIVDGRPVRICTISDVTERVQLQQELQQAQKMEAVGRLAGGIAHDFNNALTAIIGGAELLTEYIGDVHGASAEIAAIQRAAERAASLIRQLLAFSRQQVLRVEVLPLNNVVERTAALLRPTLGEQIEILTWLAPDTGAVRVDPGQLEQVLLNLAVNARDAMPGGGTLAMSTRRVAFAADTSVAGVTIPAGDYAETIVRDTGIGMDDITRLRIFEPFFTTKPPPEGTGLGLSMAYGIIRQSDGFIAVESAPGVGSTFRILLPHADRPRPMPAAPPSAPGSSAATTVLVVEDEDGVRRVTRRVLERLGYTVLEAADGEAALELVERERPSISLLVTDQIMPRIGGRELATRLLAAYPELRVLIVSGYADETAALGMLAHGMAFLPKPFSIESLGEAVRRLLADA